MIKNVIFDMGNVVLGFNCFDAIHDNAASKEDDEYLSNLMFCTPTWNEYDNGQYTNESLTELFVSKAQNETQKETIRKVMSVWSSEKYLPTSLVMIDLIKALKNAGYNLYILSNAPFEVPVEIENRGIGKLFDGKVFSCNLHINKPDVGIYNELIEKYNLNPSECVFLDDREDNIETARSLGINGIVYNQETHEDAVNTLREEYHLNF